MKSCSHSNPVRADATRRSTVESLERRALMTAAFALNEGGRLLRFDTDNPAAIQQSVRVTGLQGGSSESLRGIDYRPANGQLYLLTIARNGGQSGGGWSGNNGGRVTRIYTVNTATGAATQAGTSFTNPSLNGTYSGVDFNPVVDRIRYVNDINQNLRINPVTGQPVDADTVMGGLQADGMLAYAAADANAGRDPDDTAVAYTNPDNDPATGTTLYGIDTRRDALVIQNPPNAGTLNTVGLLGVNVGPQASFDIGAGNVAFAALQPGSGSWGGGSYSGGGSYGGGGSRLYNVNLTTGAVTNGRSIGNGERVVGLAIAPAAPAARPGPAASGADAPAFAPAARASAFSSGSRVRDLDLLA